MDGSEHCSGELRSRVLQLDEGDIKILNEHERRHRARKTNLK